MRLAKQPQFIPLQNVVYFIALPVLVRKIFTFYINDALLFKCPVLGPNGGINKITQVWNQEECEEYESASHWRNETWRSEGTEAWCTLSGIDVLLISISIRECNFLCPDISCMKQTSWQIGPRLTISSNSVKRVHKCLKAQHKFCCNYLNKNSRHSKKWVYWTLSFVFLYNFVKARVDLLRDVTGISAEYVQLYGKVYRIHYFL